MIEVNTLSIVDHLSTCLDALSLTHLSHNPLSSGIWKPSASISSSLLVLWPFSSRSLARIRYFVQFSSSSCLIVKYFAIAFDLYGTSEYFFSSVFF